MERHESIPGCRGAPQPRVAGAHAQLRWGAPRSWPTISLGATGLGSSAVENPAAYLASLPEGFNGMKGDVLKAKLDAGEQIFLLDVRQPNEFAAGRIEGAVNIPVREVPKNLAKLPQDKNTPIVVICASAVRSGYATMALSFKGYTNVKHLAAGYVAGWEKAGHPVVK